MHKVPDDLTSMSDEKLSELWNSVAAEALEAKEASRRLAHEVDRRETERRTRERFATMTDSEREAFMSLAQSVTAEAAVSEEAFGAQDEEDDE